VSEDVNIIEARERLRARLWVGDCAIDDEGRLAVAERRLWCALREGWFQAEKEGRRLSAGDLTEGLPRTLFSTAEVTVDAEGFTAWINGVVPATRPPSAPFVTAVEAAYFLARGAFLTTDDIAAIAEHQVKIVGWVEFKAAPRNPLWELAQQRLFRSHVEGALTLLGKRAPSLRADPVGETAPVPKEFFTGNVALGLFNGIYDPDHPDRAIYKEVAVATHEFKNTFLASAEPPLSKDRIVSRTRRASTRIDDREYAEWARGLHASRGFGPSLQETEKFARDRGLNRPWAREIHKSLPAELRRPLGGRGMDSYLAKPRATE
jgi:hypothetical protein